MFTDDFFDSVGVRLHYIDWGGGGRPLVLLGGLGGTAHLYRGIAPRLSEQFRVASLTRRGHGRSDRPASGYDIDTLVDDIRRFLDLLGIDRAVLGGHSWAGLEIPYFATKCPERVDAVIYLDALHVLLAPELDLSADPVLAVLERQPLPADTVSPDAYLAFVRRSRPDLASIWCEAVEADQVENMKRLARHGPANEIVAKMREGLGAHINPAYGDIRAPSLAIVPAGTTHPFLPPDATPDLVAAGNAFYVEHYLSRIRRRTELFREAVPGARIVELDTSNHTIFVAREDETAAAILAFLAENRA